MPSFKLRLGSPGLALILGLSEAAFIVAARHGIKGAGFAIIPILAAMATFRFFIQIVLARLEITAAARLVSRWRNSLLMTVREHAVPVYRPEYRRTLIRALQEIAPRAGEGLLATFRFQAAALQGAVLVPCLLFFSWRLALCILPLGAVAYLATRWRLHQLRGLERAEIHAEAMGRLRAEEFGDGLEKSLSGNLESATGDLAETLNGVSKTGAAWKRAQAHYPALMELLFFFALTFLVLGTRRLTASQGWDAWMVFSGLLLLAYRPVREAARHYPQQLQGAQAIADLEKIAREWKEYPRRALPQLSNGPGAGLVLENVDFGYGPRNEAFREKPLVFQNYSAAFDLHSITGIVGPNGAGKTTLLRLLAGVELPLYGRVCWPESLRIRGNAAYLPQRIFLERDYSDWAREFSSRDSGFWSRLDSLLGLDHLLQGAFHPEHLSGGERQRLALARVLSSDSPFLLLDEPTSAIPGHEREAILTGALKLWKSRYAVPRGALIVSHEPFLGNCCDSLFSLRRIPAPENSPA